MYRSTSTPVYANGRVVGEVQAGVFRKRIKGSKHLLRQPRAIALSASSLEEVERAGAVEIQVTDIETGVMYSASVQNFYRHSFEIHRGGFDLQRALVLERWTVTAGRSTSRAKSQATQLAMFRQ